MLPPNLSHFSYWRDGPRDEVHAPSEQAGVNTSLVALQAVPT